MAVEFDAAAGQPIECVGRGDALDLSPVFAAMGVFWVEEFGVKRGFVAEEEQTLGVCIEPPEWIKVLGKTERGQRAPARAGLGRELGEHAVGFMESQEQGRESEEPRAQ